MRFYNREPELSRLSEIADLSMKTSHMVVITGRRRVGKTELIRQFTKQREDVLYFFVSKKKPHILIEEFIDILAEKIPLMKTVTFRSFEESFAFVFGYMKEKSLIIVFDEFQNFEYVDPSIFSTIQNHWDLDELTSYYNVIERRIPVTEYKYEKKIGRYYIKDPALRFWFRYIFRNQSLIEIGDERGLTEKIMNDLPTLMGRTFEELVMELLIKRNNGDVIPFKFVKIGGFWTRKGDIEIDIVALNEEEGKILIGECKLKGSKFKQTDVQRLKEKAEYIKWRTSNRKEYYVLFSMDAISEAQKKSLEKESVLAFDMKSLL